MDGCIFTATDQHEVDKGGGDGLQEETPSTSTGEHPGSGHRGCSPQQQTGLVSQQRRPVKEGPKSSPPAEGD